MPLENSMDVWVPLVEFAARRGVSLSTLRRHIKANKIRHKKENGRYLIFDQDQPGRLGRGKKRKEEEMSRMQVQVKKLESDLQRAQKEIAELKTLIALYEEQIPERFNN